uniref:NIDO domain-containing protein n=1 Tax=Romanomermis culicivorax TaxID=13658 RepID=A0A915IWX5_ROMCU
MEIYSELPVGEVRRTGLAPMYQKVDLTRGGGIYVREITDHVQLDKISMAIEDEFHDKDFNANIAFVVTYDDVIQINQQDDSVSMVLPDTTW